MDNLKKAMWDNGSLIVLTMVGLAIAIAAAVSAHAGSFTWKGLFLMVLMIIVALFCLYGCVVEVIASLREEKSRSNKTP